MGAKYGNKINKSCVDCVHFSLHPVLNGLAPGIACNRGKWVVKHGDTEVEFRDYMHHARECTLYDGAS